MADTSDAAADSSVPIEADAPIDPLMHLLALKFIVVAPGFSDDERSKARADIIAEVRQFNMIKYVEFAEELLGDGFSTEDRAAMIAANEKRLAELDARIEDARANEGDSEWRDALLAKCDFFARIGDRDNCIKCNLECGAKTLGLGPRVDLCFQRIRVGLAFSDHAIVKKAVEDAAKLVKDADWERRNRFRVYEGLYCVSVRNFDKGSKLLLDSIQTFAATELMSLQEFIFITATSSLIRLDRASLKRSLVDSPEVVSANVTEISDLLNAVYQCRYADVIPCLAKVCDQMARNVFLTLHVNFYFREVRVLAFNQFLDSYSSVTLKSMANAFRLPVQVLDTMLYTLISNDRLSCKVDRVSGNVHTYRGDNTNIQYHAIVREGDLLLNRLQKLSRIVEL